MGQTLLPSKGRLKLASLRGQPWNVNLLLKLKLTGFLWHGVARSLPKRCANTQLLCVTKPVSTKELPGTLRARTTRILLSCLRLQPSINRV